MSQPTDLPLEAIKKYEAMTPAERVVFILIAVGMHEHDARKLSYQTCGATERFCRAAYRASYLALRDQAERLALRLHLRSLRRPCLEELRFYLPLTRSEWPHERIIQTIEQAIQPLHRRVSDNIAELITENSSSSLLEDKLTA